MNRHNRRTQQAEDRKAKRRGKNIALAHKVMADLADRDDTIIGATLILPDGEVTFVDAATLRRGGGRA